MVVVVVFVFGCCGFWLLWFLVVVRVFYCCCGYGFLFLVVDLDFDVVRESLSQPKVTVVMPVRGLNVRVGVLYFFM